MIAIVLTMMIGIAMKKELVLLIKQFMIIILALLTQEFLIIQVIKYFNGIADTDKLVSESAMLTMTANTMMSIV